MTTVTAAHPLTPLTARAQSLLDGIIEGHWMLAEERYRTTIHNGTDLIAELLCGLPGEPSTATARFITAAPELVRELLAALHRAEHLTERIHALAETWHDLPCGEFRYAAAELHALLEEFVDASGEVAP